MDTTQIGQDLFQALWDAGQAASFVPLVNGLVAALDEAGLQVGRMQLPLMRDRGFRHPTLAGLLLTWTDTQEGSSARALTHEQVADRALSPVSRSPYWQPLQTGEPYVATLSDDTGFEILDELHADGYRSYVVLPIPTGEPGQFQPLSIASRQAFPDDLLARLARLTPMLSMTVYAAYRASQAITLANAYIGPESGPRVLAGDIRRGSTRRLRAGVVFCDIRGFTALTEQVGAEAVVGLVNQVFAHIDDEARKHGGEILKFIGDAVLLVFPSEGRTDAAVAQDLLAMARHAADRVAEANLGVRVGFGGHIGEVVQGNIGTPDRVDFTVLGAAVNLASRLESLCKPLEATGVFSTEVAAHTQGLKPRGPQALKGVSEPVSVWVF